MLGVVALHFLAKPELSKTQALIGGLPTMDTE